MGKVVGGGLPAAAYGGRRELMSQMAPDGPVYQAGTLSGNPLAMAAGLETLRRLREPGSYEALEEHALRLTRGLEERAAAAGVELSTACVGGMFGFFFHPGPVQRFEDVKKAHAGRFRAFFAAMLEGGVYLAPSPYEAGFVCLAHTPQDIDASLEAAAGALRRASELR